MEIGMIGLGRMGSNMAQRLSSGGHRVVAYDKDTDARLHISSMDIPTVSSISELIAQVSPPRYIFCMLPSGEPTESIILFLKDELTSGDTVLDGGNANYKESIRRYELLAKDGIHFLDVGISGGIWGLDHGYSLMVGGDKSSFTHIEPIFQTLSPTPDTGYSYVGKRGSGHFVKMIHNAVEYGMMQAYAEGFELLEAKTEFELDLQTIAETWRFGSVVRSWLLDLTSEALSEDAKLSGLEGYVEDTGEGRWAVHESVDLAIPAPIITLSLLERFRSRQDNPLGRRLLAALRKQFGGHSIKPSE